MNTQLDKDQIFHAYENELLVMTDDGEIWTIHDINTNANIPRPVRLINDKLEIRECEIFDLYDPEGKTPTDPQPKFAVIISGGQVENIVSLHPSTFEMPFVVIDRDNAKRGGNPWQVMNMQEQDTPEELRAEIQNQYGREDAEQ